MICYMKKEKREAETPVNNAFAEAVKGIGRDESDES